MENTNKRLHIVVFPWLAFGHMIPFLQLSKRLASKGHQIYYISTPRNLQRLEPNIPQNLSPLITLVPVPLPRHESLPLDAEATTDVGFAKGTDALKFAFDGLQEPVTRFLGSSQTNFDWIILDFCSHWVLPIADRLSIRKAYFGVTSLRLFSVIGRPLSKEIIDDDEDSSWSPEIFTKPIEWITIPNSSVYFLPHEAKKIMFATKKNSTGVSDMFRIRSVISGCDVLVVRSCMELEAEYLQLTGELLKKVVLPIGMMPAATDERGREENESWPIISGWLERYMKGSVVYIAFGSEFGLSQNELTELAFGLEQSNVPFFWALRKSAGDSDSSSTLPDGFEERTRDRGMVWSSWAPQVRTLAHDSVGGFLTHCGGSSVTEGLQFGKPLIMLPLALDHGLCARFMVEKKVGVEIPRDEESGWFSRNSVAKSLALVMQDESTGKMYKDEARKLSKIVADESLQDQYIDEFVEFLQSKICKFEKGNSANKLVN